MNRRKWLDPGIGNLTCVVVSRLIILGLTIASSIASPSAYAQSDGEAWVELFNGEDLTDWVAKIRGYAPGENFADTFRVEDGLLTVAYDGYDEFGDRYGHLFYRQPFSHYRLRVEYRFVGDQVRGGESWATRNSGVMIHARDPSTMPPQQDFPISLEAQFLGGLSDGKPRPTANMCSPGTHIVYQGQFTEEHCIPSKSATFDGDQWVTVEVLVLGGDRVVHLVNGEPVIEYISLTYGGGAVSGHLPEMKPDGEPVASGFIALQSESHPIQFRRVALLNLKGCTDPEAKNHKTYYLESDPDSCLF